MYFTCWCKNPTHLCEPSNHPISNEVVQDQQGNLRKFGKTYAMVLCLHQRNIYIKRKLRIWRDRKCIFLVGAKSPLTCARLQSTPSQWRRYGAEKGNLRIMGWTYRHGIVLAPRQYLYQKEATGMERPEMYFPSRCKKPTHLCEPSNHPVSNEAV